MLPATQKLQPAVIVMDHNFNPAAFKNVITDQARFVRLKTVTAKLN